MEKKDLDQIAKETGLELPEHFTSFMLKFPTELYDLENEAGEPFADYEFLDDPERILEINAEVREDPYYSEEDEKERDWPANFLVIGENGNGDYYCIDVDNDFPIVYFFDHNEGDFTEAADDFESFTEHLKNEQEDIIDRVEEAVKITADDEDEDDES